MNYKYKLLASAAAASSVIPLSAFPGNKGEKPMNVILFLVDDLGWMDTGCYGSKFYETPNIDKLARDGVRFTNAYAACHVSSPTRASLLTGKYPASINLTDWLPGRKNFPFQKLKNVEINQQLPYELPTVSSLLKKRGYSTAIIGKWHLGEEPGSTSGHGFDIHIPDWNKGWPNKGYFQPYGLKGLESGPEGEYLTDRLTQEAINYIEQNRDKPFFLYMSHFAVHDPVEGRPDLVEKYKMKLGVKKNGVEIKYILEGNPDQVQNHSGKIDVSHDGYKIFEDNTVKIKQIQDNVQFAAMVESMDESLGRIMKKLEDEGLDDNTIIIFYSDNGGMSAANFYDPKRSIKEENLDKTFSTSNLPLRAGKGWLYEGGIRVPLIVKLPGKGLKGIISDVPVTSPDLLPTIMDILGVKDVALENSDGVSLKPLLKGKKTLKREAIYWHFPHYSNHGMQSPGGAVRWGDYKLIEYYENNSVQLFNLKNDIEEMKDISKTEPEITDRLKRMLDTWRKSVNAKTMEPNPEYKN
ncbi:sulfatase [Bacteroidota bacterium]